MNAFSAFAPHRTTHAVVSASGSWQHIEGQVSYDFSDKWEQCPSYISSDMYPISALCRGLRGLLTGMFFSNVLSTIELHTPVDGRSNVSSVQSGGAKVSST